MGASVAPGEADSFGNVERYFSRGPVDVPPDAMWISVIGFYLTLPLNIFMIILGTCSDAVFRWIVSIAVASTQWGRPLCLAPIWWWYQPIGAARLICANKSRFTLFSESRKAMGGGDWWWHGQGAWNCPYEQVRATMASDQKRSPAFGAIKTCVPELFPAKNLLFIDGEEWRNVRGVLETNLTDEASWGPRVAQLKAVLAPLAPLPCTLDTLTKPTTDKMVATAVWFLLFGVTLSDAQAKTAASWGASGLAGVFVFPRLIQRIAFNLLLKKVRKLRVDTVNIVRAQGLAPLFEQLNAQLPPAYRRESALALCDEYMYAVNFAGVGGTQHGCWGTLQFLRRSTVDVPAKDIVYPEGSMAELYKASPRAFITEAVRLDAPVTSATCAFREEQTVDFNSSCCGKSSSHALMAGTLHQYVLSIANRDPAKFTAPNAFDPSRANLDDMVGWNGAISGGSKQYPRFCPGQKLSVTVIETICSFLDEVA